MSLRLSAAVTLRPLMLGFKLSQVSELASAPPAPANFTQSHRWHGRRRTSSYTSECPAARAPPPSASECPVAGRRPRPGAAAICGFSASRTQARAAGPGGVLSHLAAAGSVAELRRPSRIPQADSDHCDS